MRAVTAWLPARCAGRADRTRHSRHHRDERRESWRRSLSRSAVHRRLGQKRGQNARVLPRWRTRKKLVAKETIGSPAEEGYLRRGLIRDQIVEKTAGNRFVDMAMAKKRASLSNPRCRPRLSRLFPCRRRERILKAKVMLITDGGLVPKGQSGSDPGYCRDALGAYNIKDSDDLRGEDYEVSHGGYDTRFVQDDPDRLVPLDALREMERSGIIGKLNDEFLSTCGRSNPLSNTRRLGREMAEKVKRDGVDA